MHGDRDSDAAPQGPTDADGLYAVSVRALCAFGARRGDLDPRLGPSPSARDGQHGHRLVTGRRGPGYQREVALEQLYRRLRVRGRADGVDLQAGHVEEIKTHRGPVSRIPEAARALHRAQARCYAWMLCAAEGLEALEVRVVYFDIDRESETVIAERCSADMLQAAFAQLCEAFVDWADAEQRHRRARDAWLRALAWPHAGFRDGQRQLATAVYQAARRAAPLLVQAPTGLGKTLATVFPMLKALPGSERHAPIDKLLYLTAKTSGRALALGALAQLRASTRMPAPLRVVTLPSREQACAHPGVECRGSSCPLARGHHDRLPAARAAAVDAAAAADPQALATLARSHEVCSYHLAQELARWADVIVADYHHAFDPAAWLPALAADQGWRVAALVDEAHNLVPRARDMLGAELTPAGWQALRAALPAPLRRRADRVRRHWRALDATLVAQPEPFACHDAVPDGLQQALTDLARGVSDWLVETETEFDTEREDGSAPPLLDPAARDGWFQLLRFLDRAALLDAHGQFEVAADTRGRAASAAGARAAPPSSRLTVRNVMPALHLRSRWAQWCGTVLFSATLQPAALQARLLGLPDDTPWLDLPTPFDPGRLRVRRATALSTRFADRARSAPALADLIAGQVRHAPGNYLAFVSSFDYLARLQSQLQDRHPGLPVVAQQRGMDPAARDAYLAGFVAGGRRLGLAVLGGVFGEGVDLPGTRLVGVFIATLGLPQFDAVHESVRRRLDRLVGDGHAATYLMPGLQKVVQAAGRVIRAPDDEGLVVLVDDRYARAEVRALLPPWWRVERWAGPEAVAAPDATVGDAVA